MREERCDLHQHVLFSGWVVITGGRERETETERERESKRERQRGGERSPVRCYK